MKGRNRSDAKQLVARMASGVLIVTSGLVFGGCGREIARLEESKLKLQAMVHKNVEQIASSVSRIEENQSKTQAALEDIRARTAESATGIAGARQEHIKLQETLQKNSEQVASDMNRLEQDQLEFATKMLTHIGTIADLAGDISTVQKGRIEHEKKILADIRALADVVNAIEQRQSKLQGQVVEVQNNTEAMRKNIVAVLEWIEAELSKVSAQIGSAGTVEDEPSGAEPKTTVAEQ